MPIHSVSTLLRSQHLHLISLLFPSFPCQCFSNPFLFIFVRFLTIPYLLMSIRLHNDSSPFFSHPYLYLSLPISTYLFPFLSCPFSFLSYPVLSLPFRFTSFLYHIASSPRLSLPFLHLSLPYHSSLLVIALFLFFSLFCSLLCPAFSLPISSLPFQLALV